MTSGDCLIFDLWGDYGHFRTIYATSSPLTYPFPPKPSLIGILSAMIGFDKAVYLNEFYRSDFWIAVRILNPVKKIRLTENYSEVKKWKPETRVKMLIGEKVGLKDDMLLTHTQIRLEMLKDPKFRIYIHHSDKQIMDKLEAVLKSHSPEYTITLGLSENLADFEYFGKSSFEFKKVDTERPTMISSVIKKTHLHKGRIELEEGLDIEISNMPVEMSQERIVSEYAEFLMDREGKPMKALVEKYIIVNDENLLPL